MEHNEWKHITIPVSVSVPAYSNITDTIEDAIAEGMTVFCDAAIADIVHEAIISHPMNLRAVIRVGEDYRFEILVRTLEKRIELTIAAYHLPTETCKDITKFHAFQVLQESWKVDWSLLTEWSFEAVHDLVCELVEWIQHDFYMYTYACDWDRRKHEWLRAKTIPETTLV